MTVILGSPGGTDIQWWKPSLDKALVHSKVIAHQRRLADRCEQWNRMDRFHASLYADMPVTGLGPFEYSTWAIDSECARLNLVKAASDSWVAAMMKNFPRPQTITEKGNWDLKRRGEGMNRWLSATFDSTGMPNDLAPYVSRIAAVHGTGVVKVFEDVPGGPDGKHWGEATVGISSCFPWDFTFAEGEAQDPRNIRTLYYQQWYDVDVLCEMFPKSEDDIRQVARGGDAEDDLGGSGQAPNLIKVTEGYHLRSSRLADDGARAVCIPGVTLARVTYELDRFPFAVLRRAKAPMGWRGIGLPQELRGMQQTINEVMLAYEEAMVFFARPKWMVPRGSGVQRAHLDDRIGSIVEFDGPVAPVMYVPGAIMPGDVMAVLQMLWERGFEQPGISSLFAGGQVPQGLKSGEAIRRYNDTGQARAVESLKLQEQWCVDVADLCVESGRVIAKKSPKYCSQFDGKRSVELVYFAKVDPGERDKFRFKVFPTNALTGTLSDKIEQLDLLANHNPPLIDEHTYRVLLDWTDIDEENSLANAPYEVLDAILSEAYDSDDPAQVLTDSRNTPDPNWPLAYMKARCQFAAARAFIDGAPDDLLSAISAYVDLITEVMERPPPKPVMTPAPAPPMAGPPPGGGPQMGPPMGAPIAPGGPQTIPAGAPMPQAA